MTTATQIIKEEIRQEGLENLHGSSVSEVKFRLMELIGFRREDDGEEFTTRDVREATKMAPAIFAKIQAEAAAEAEAEAAEAAAEMAEYEKECEKEYKKMEALDAARDARDMKELGWMD